MIDWVAIAGAIATAVQAVGGELVKEGLKTSLKPASEQFDTKFLRGYKAKQHEDDLRRALQATEEAFRQSPGVSALQADAVLTRVAKLATDKNLQQKTLATLLTLDDPSPTRISDDLLRAFGLNDPARAALATFLDTFRLHFAQIKQYEPLLKFALELRAAKQRDQTNLWLAAMATAQGIVATSNEAQALDDYLAHVRDKHTYLSFLFVRPRSREATTEAELEAVFVPLQVHDPEAEEKARRKLERAALREQAEREELKPQTINDILPRYDYVLLKGAPGSGKTTLLRHLALAFANGDAREKLAWEGTPLLPILIPLRNFGKFLDEHRKEFPDPAPMSLLTYIQDHFAKNALALTPSFFRERLDNGKCLVLLDALDEVSDPELRACVAQHVTSFSDRYRKRGNRFVLSSRPKGYEEVAEYLPRPTVCTVQRLMPDGRAELVRKLCRALERDAARASRDAATLLEEIPQKEKVDELSRNPLFCTTIVLVSKYRGATLPERRVDIFKEIVELLLGFWDTSRYDVAEAFQLATDDGTGRAFRDVGEAVEAKQRALAHLAYWMQQTGHAETIETDALAQLETFFRDREGEKNVPDKWARGFLVIAHQRSGLFVEGAPNLYNFSHSNFREYLAATELVKELDSDLTRMVLEHVGDAWWEETILLALALKELGDPRRKLLMDEMLQHGHLLMAGKAAVDMSDRLAAPLRDEIVTKLQTLMQSIDAPIKTRASAGETLDALGWLPDDLDAFVHLPGDSSKRINEFFIAKYPVTYHQYEKFVDAGGYATERYWRDQTGVDEKGKEKKLGDEAWEWLQSRGGAERRPYEWDNPRFHRAGYPVVGITWYEASAYCQWLTEQLAVAGFKFQVERNGQLETVNLKPETTVRLPTESEWILAAGGEENNRYPWDSPVTPALAADASVARSEATKQSHPHPFPPLSTTGESEGGGSLLAMTIARANVEESELNGTTPVAMYPGGARITENGDQIFDLAGNVWEWTSNTFEESYRGAYLRGGSWYWKAEEVNAAARDVDHRYVGLHYFGVRVVVASHGFPRT